MNQQKQQSSISGLSPLNKDISSLAPSPNNRGEDSLQGIFSRLNESLEQIAQPFETDPMLRTFQHQTSSYLNSNQKINSSSKRPKEANQVLSNFLAKQELEKHKKKMQVKLDAEPQVQAEQPILQNRASVLINTSGAESPELNKMTFNLNPRKIDANEVMRICASSKEDISNRAQSKLDENRKHCSDVKQTEQLFTSIDKESSLIPPHLLNSIMQGSPQIFNFSLNTQDSRSELNVDKQFYPQKYDFNTYEFFNPILENHLVQINKERMVLAKNNPEVKQKIFKQIQELIVHRVSTKIDDRFPELPNLTKKQGVKEFNKLFLQSQNMQKLLSDFQFQLDKLIETEFKYNSDQLKMFVSHPREFSEDKKLINHYSKYDLEKQKKEQKIMAQSLDFAHQKFNYLREKTLQKKKERLGIRRGAPLQHEECKVNIVKVNRPSQAAKKKGSQSPSKKDGVKPKFKVITDFQNRLLDHTESINELIESIDKDNQLIRQDIKNFENEVDILQEEMRVNHYPKDPGLKLQKVLNDIDSQPILTNTDLVRYQHDMWMTLEEFQEALKKEETGYELRERYLINLYNTRIDNLKQKSQCRILALEQALLETKMEKNLEIERATMQIEDYKSKQLQIFISNEEMANAENKLDLMIDGVRNLKEAKKVMREMKEMIEKNHEQFKLMGKQMEELRHNQATFERKLGLAQQEYFTEMDLRIYYQHLLLKFARDVELYCEDIFYLEKFNKIDENQHYIQQKYNKETLDEIHFEDKLIEFANQYNGMKQWALELGQYVVKSGILGSFYKGDEEIFLRWNKVQSEWMAGLYDMIIKLNEGDWDGHIDKYSGQPLTEAESLIQIQQLQTRESIKKPSVDLLNLIKDQIATNVVENDELFRDEMIEKVQAITDIKVKEVLDLTVSLGSLSNPTTASAQVIKKTEQSPVNKSPKPQQTSGVKSPNQAQRPSKNQIISPKKVKDVQSPTAKSQHKTNSIIKTVPTQGSQEKKNEDNLKLLLTEPEAISESSEVDTVSELEEPEYKPTETKQFFGLKKESLDVIEEVQSPMAEPEIARFDLNLQQVLPTNSNSSSLPQTSPGSNQFLNKKLPKTSLINVRQPSRKISNVFISQTKEMEVKPLPGICLIDQEIKNLLEPRQQEYTGGLKNVVKKNQDAFKMKALQTTDLAETVQKSLATPLVFDDKNKLMQLKEFKQFAVQFNEMLSEKYDFKKAIKYIKSKGEDDSAESISAANKRSMVARKSTTKFNLQPRMKPSEVDISLISTPKIGDILNPVIDPDGTFRGFTLRQQFLQALYATSSFKIQPIKRVIKLVIYLNRLLHDFEDYDFKLLQQEKNDFEEDYDEPKFQSTGIQVDVEELQNNIDSDSSNDHVSANDDYPTKVLKLLKSHAIDILVRMNPTQKNYYKLVWDGFDFEKLLEYKLANVFKDSEHMKKDYLGVGVTYKTYLETIFGLITKKMQETYLDPELKEKLCLDKLIEENQLDDKVTRDIGILTDSVFIKSVEEMNWVDNFDPEQLKTKSNIHKQVQAQVVTQLKEVQTGPELLPKPDPVIIELPPKIIYKKEASNIETMRSKVRNQLVLDKAMEDEFRKTLDVFDTFVQSIGRINPEKLKLRAFHNTALEFKTTQMLDDGSSDEDTESQNEYVSKNLKSIREKINTVVDFIHQDIKKQNQPFHIPIPIEDEFTVQVQNKEMEKMNEPSLIQNDSALVNRQNQMLALNRQLFPVKQGSSKNFDFVSDLYKELMENKNETQQSIPKIKVAPRQNKMAPKQMSYAPVNLTFDNISPLRLSHVKSPSANFMFQGLPAQVYKPKINFPSKVKEKREAEILPWLTKTSLNSKFTVNKSLNQSMDLQHFNLTQNNLMTGPSTDDMNTSSNNIEFTSTIFKKNRRLDPMYHSNDFGMQHEQMINDLTERKLHHYQERQDNFKRSIVSKLHSPIISSNQQINEQLAQSRQMQANLLNKKTMSNTQVSSISKRHSNNDLLLQ